ncbi:hypothetical protein GCM10011385_18850 [Nitratireductor aestuarii]|uniref:Biofilm-associated protein BapA-like prefix-like domain-containing protein n=1 Tax=Nitratireductor aestuarii TaxID=1735103 RepID=A0A916RQY8_9HYPH|nr:VCBS domain-containing protein [Nitratireductor aestuarii]GGA65281.1 hypothetical protein GCM10011385_18850 [Nitratireductor aestuarii]
MVETLFDKTNSASRTAPESSVVLDPPRVFVVLPYAQSEVAGFMRKGRDLIIQLRNGRNLRMANYYETTEHPRSEMVFQESDGTLWVARPNKDLTDFEFTQIESVDHLLGTTGQRFSWNSFLGFNTGTGGAAKADHAGGKNAESAAAAPNPLKSSNEESGHLETGATPAAEKNKGESGMGADAGADPRPQAAALSEPPSDALGHASSEIDAVDDLVGAEVSIVPVTTVRKDHDAKTFLFNLKGFKRTYEFEVPEESRTHALFTISSDSVLGLGNTMQGLYRYVEARVGGRWIPLEDTSFGGVTEFGQRSKGILMSVRGLDAGMYRLVYGTKLTLSVMSKIQLDVRFKDTSLVHLAAKAGPAFSGHLLDGSGSEEGIADKYPDDGKTVLNIDSGKGTFDPVTDGMTVAGKYGTLTVNRDGTYSYQVNADVSAIGKVDVFSYKLVHPTEGEDEAKLFVQIGSQQAELTWDESDLSADGWTMVVTDNTGHVEIAPARKASAGTKSRESRDIEVPVAATEASGNVMSDDVRGSPFTVLKVSQDGTNYKVPGFVGTELTGAHGVLTIHANGDYVYRPHPDPAGIGQSDTFTYRLVHPNGSAAEAKLTIDIGAAAPADHTLEGGAAVDSVPLGIVGDEGAKIEDAPHVKPEGRGADADQPIASADTPKPMLEGLLSGGSDASDKISLPKGPGSVENPVIPTAAENAPATVAPQEVTDPFAHLTNTPEEEHQLAVAV